MKNKSQSINPVIIGTKMDLNSVSSILKSIEGKDLFADKIEYAKNTLSKLKTLPTRAY